MSYVEQWRGLIGSALLLSGVRFVTVQVLWSRSVRAEILEREFAFPIVKGATAAGTKQRLIIGRGRLNAYDHVLRLTLGALEVGHHLCHRQQA